MPNLEISEEKLENLEISEEKKANLGISSSYNIPPNQLTYNMMNTTLQSLLTVPETRLLNRIAVFTLGTSEIKSII